MIRAMKRIVAMGLLLGLGGVSAGLSLDLADNNTGISGNQPGDYFVHNSDADDETIVGSSGSGNLILDPTSNYLFGASDGTVLAPVNSEGKVAAQFQSVRLDGGSISLVNSAREGNEGTTITTDRLNANGGGSVVLGSSGSTESGRYNQLTVNSFLADGTAEARVVIDANSKLTVRNAADWGGANAVDLKLGSASEKGYAVFQNGLTLRNGSITGNADISGNVTLSGAGAVINASGGEHVYHGNVTVDSGGGEIIVGYPGVGGKSSLEITGTLSVQSSSAMVVVEGDSRATSGNLTVGNLALSGGGTVNVGGYGNLVVGSRLTPAETTIANGFVNVGADGTATFNNSVRLNASGGMYTNGGTIVFNNGLAMQDGAVLSIENDATVDLGNSATIGSGTILAQGAGNSLVVGGGLTLASRDALKLDGGSATLSVLRSANGALGALNLAGPESIHFGAGSNTLNAGDVTILTGASGELYTTDPAGSAVINANSFTVASGADVRGHANVDTVVAGNARVMGKYDAAGNEYFLRGLQVMNGGELSAENDNALIHTGEDGKRTGAVVMNGGTLSSQGGYTLALVNDNTGARSTLAFSGNKSVVSGTVVAQGLTASDPGFDISVSGDLDLDLNNTSLEAATYTQTKGTVQGTNGTNQWIRANDGRALISGRGSVFSANAEFSQGVAFTNGATLRSSANETLRILGSTGYDFSMGAGTVLDLSDNDISVLGYDKVTINGKIRLGAKGLGLNMLDTGFASSVTANLRNIELGESFVQAYRYDGAVYDYIFYDNTPVLGTPRKDSHSIANVFGNYLFRYEQDNGTWLESVTTKDVADVAGVRNTLGGIWGRKAVSTGFATNVSAVARNVLDPADGAFASPSSSVAGNLNYEILKAFALNNGSYSTEIGGRTYSGSIDRGLFSAYTGAAASGVTYVNQDVTKEIITTLHSRVADIRDLSKELETIGSTQALGSMTVGECLNNQYLNRFWAGGLSTWQHASARKGFDGYKYDGQGVIVGYDRAFGSSGAVIGGLSFAYMKGDYKDRSAISHDSTIKNYAVDAYMTYNACSGFFLTLMGGYNYGDNDIREMRGGNWAEQDYHTNTWHAAGKLGYDFAPSANFTMTPSVGVNFVHSRSSAHQLNLSGVNLLSYGKMKNHNVEIPVEMNVAYNVTITDDRDLTLMANGGWAYNLNDHGVTGNVGINDVYGSVPMRAVGRKLGHNAWNAGAGAKYRQGNWDATVKYDYTGRSQFHGHRLMGTVGYSF